MTLDRHTRDRLAHDVGKYIVRAALNLPTQGEIPGGLARMLVDDLYGTAERPSALEVFDALVSEPKAPHLVEARTHLARILQLEPRVRSGDTGSVRAAAAEALAVAALLGAL